MILDDDFEAKVEAHLASTPDNQPRYTTARLRAEVAAAKKAARLYALEEAAKVAEAARIEQDDTNEPGDDDWWSTGVANGQADNIARRIRQLMKETA